jgi:hypothetical protein
MCNPPGLHIPWLKPLCRRLVAAGNSYMRVLQCMARFLFSSHNFGVELGRHQGVVWFARGCKRCAALGMHDLPVDDEAHLLFSCPAPAWLGGSVNCHLRRCRMCCRDVCRMALFVLKCINTAYAAATATARQQPRRS